MNVMEEVFGIDCFSELELKKRVPETIFKRFKAVQRGEEELSNDVADVIANAVKNWAVERGATHFTHWFQPLTDLTAEKHESFVATTKEGLMISQFSGKELIKGEADTSSFPSGGLRSTFEARGYTAWDVSSPMFLKGTENAKSLYIPTAYVGYHGEALDKKVPLLRSITAVTSQTMRILRLLGDTETKNVDVTLGIEQEYFLVDKKYWDKRQDLALTDRTLFGNLPPKGQEMNDHYYGTIKERVQAFMGELDKELWKIGVVAKTKHNEVAPNQCELASMFAVANVAVDQNHLVMDTMKKVAGRHGLVAILHEKPFSGVNGSGKHCNWSLATDTGRNLLDPKILQKGHLEHLLVMTAVVEGVDRYAELLRATTATPGNDHRLGGHEAPPAIISIFLGDQLEDMYDHIDKYKFEKIKRTSIDLGVHIPRIKQDFSDRNRTSPMAFTGNKFEFRMPGSSAAASTPVFVLNTIVADILREYADKLEGTPASKMSAAVIDLVKTQYKKHKRVVFSGNGYDKSWVTEATKRGLCNLPDTVSALPVYKKKSVVELFERNAVLSKDETLSRYNIYVDRYNKQINIDLSIAIRMAKNEVYPAVVKYATEISNMILAVKGAIGNEDLTQYDKEHLEKVLNLKIKLKDCITSLTKGLDIAADVADTYKRAVYYRDKLLPIYNELRDTVDSLELLIDSSIWTIPTYYDMLFKL